MGKGKRIGLGASLPAGEHLEGHGGERVDVHAGRRRRAVQLLGRHVAEAAHERARAGDVGPVGDVGHAQIGELHGALVSEQDVGRLDVAVDDAARVDRIQGGRDPFENPQGLIWTHPAARSQEIGQRLPLDVLHDDHQVAVVLCVGVVDGDEVGVIQGCPDQRLTLEPQQTIRIAGAVDALERDFAAKQRVLCKRHSGHAAGA